MNKSTLTALGATAALAATFASASLPAQAKVSEKFYGVVTHVSETNIKVQDPANGKVMSFVYVPGVSIVADTGNPEQMKDVHTGEPVAIVYDTTVLGARHLDRIVTLHNGLPKSYHNRY